MLERLWAPWRGRYVRKAEQEAFKARTEGEGTLFQRILGSDLSDEQARICWRGETCFALLNTYPYCTGHLMVVPYRPVADLADLTKQESAELWLAVQAAVAALRTAYEPHGVNVGINLGAAAGAGEPDHLHVHCLPRWRGDTNFTTTVAETRVLPESLDETWAKLSAAWPTDGSR